MFFMICSWDGRLVFIAPVDFEFWIRKEIGKGSIGFEMCRPAALCEPGTEMNARERS